MKRRKFLSISVFSLGLSILGFPAHSSAQQVQITKLILSDDQWKKRLNPKQYQILRQEATERPFSSPLNKEKRAGIYACVACDLPLFDSQAKYDSGTGWPSFSEAIAKHIETKTDFKLLIPRKEYHCARCGGHQGHVFNDGPKPTGKRYCNNGLALKFISA